MAGNADASKWSVKISASLSSFKNLYGVMDKGQRKGTQTRHTQSAQGAKSFGVRPAKGAERELKRSAALKMSGSQACLPSCFLLVTCFGHSLVMTVGLQQNFKSEMFNFYHTLMLEEGKETTIFLSKEMPKRCYFVLKESKISALFRVRVTPCDVPIEWSIRVPKISANYFGKTISDNLNTPEALRFQKATKKVWTLFSYRGNSVETYTGASYHSTAYMLEFLSIEKDTHITVYLTTDPRSDHFYPELPVDPRIDVIDVGPTTVTLAWKQSPSALPPPGSLQYCLLVNENYNYKSLCAAETAAQALGVEWPPALGLSPSAGRLAPQQLKALSRSELSLSKKGSSAAVKQVCVGVRSTYTVSHLTPGVQYYFDVFVVNFLTNTSAAYTGTFARTLENPEPIVSQLKDGKVVQLRLDGRKQSFYTLLYQAKQKQVQFAFQSCSGQLQVQISKEGEVLMSESFAGLRHFILKGRLGDTYLVHLWSTGSSAASVKVQVSSLFHKPFFPALPESLKIKSFNKLRSCNSVTIAWLGTQELSKYCIYKKVIGEDQAWMETRKVDRCSGPESRQKSEKVLCKFFHDLNLQRAVTAETIGGLEAGTAYLLDVYLIGSSGIPVRYYSRVVKTRKRC
ncbi:protein NDNF-like [Candoia aspera]|uniref:protein NDNF-like n=1 Tax=Candoia aspera TaxID=51853 RepID=UPI002FD7ABE7